MLDTAPRSIEVRAFRHLPAALAAADYLLQGLAWRAAIARGARIPVFRAVTALVAEGNGRLEALRFVSNGREHRVSADHLLLHDGVIPDTQISLSLACAHRWHPVQRCWQPETDAWGGSPIEGVAFAGDCAGVAGARAAELTGRLAALAAAAALGRLRPDERDRLAGPMRRSLARHRAVRPFLDALYAPPPMLGRPADEAVLCRCENVTAQSIRAALRIGLGDPNVVKLATRCGMGACQGRTCGPLLTELIAAETGIQAEAIAPSRVRTPLVPLTLQEMAALREPPSA
jgi:NADPH-dependent 2,4-dienoyl-CoA reductase/sulfur reductase-like enzyme